MQALTLLSAFLASIVALWAIGEVASRTLFPLTKPHHNTPIYITPGSVHLRADGTVIICNQHGSISTMPALKLLSLHTNSRPVTDPTNTVLSTLYLSNNDGTGNLLVNLVNGQSIMFANTPSWSRGLLHANPVKFLKWMKRNQSYHTVDTIDAESRNQPHHNHRYSPTCEAANPTKSRYLIPPAYAHNPNTANSDNHRSL